MCKVSTSQYLHMHMVKNTTKPKNKMKYRETMWLIQYTVKHSCVWVYIELMMFGGCELHSRPSLTAHTKTDGHDKSEFRLNSTFTLHPQEMITAERHLINSCLCVWPERPWSSTQAQPPLHTHTHKRMGAHKYTQAHKANMYSITERNLLTFYKLLLFVHNSGYWL